MPTGNTEYVTQGTIQIKFNDTKKTDKYFSAWINPAADYSVKHQQIGYTIFILTDKSSTKAVVASRDQKFLISKEPAKSMPPENTKIEITIRRDKKKYQITSLKIPADF